MRTRVSFLRRLLLLIFAATLATATDYDGASTIGPAKGWLIIDGGGFSQASINRFVSLAGGPNANFVFIPTAQSDQAMEKAGFFRGHGRGLLQKWGINPDHVTMIHTRDKRQANAEEFIEALRNASGVVIWGGRQWRLADAYLGTAVESGIKELLARGGAVIGGSAGATIQGSYLVRGDPGRPGNPEGDNRIMMASGTRNWIWAAAKCCD